MRLRSVDRQRHLSRQSSDQSEGDLCFHNIEKGELIQLSRNDFFSAICNPFPSYVESLSDDSPSWVQISSTAGWFTKHWAQ